MPIKLYCHALNMTNSTIVQSSLLGLPDDTGAHVFSFLTTAEMAMVKGANKTTNKNLRSAVLLRRAFSIIGPEYQCFDAISAGSSVAKEQRVLTSIRDKLLNERGAHPDFVATIDTNSLMDFNRSISWLERYEEDDEFIDLLLPSHAPELILWTNEEQVYVDNWKAEFRGWLNENWLHPLNLEN